MVVNAISFRQSKLWLMAKQPGSKPFVLESLFCVLSSSKSKQLDLLGLLIAPCKASM
jgi:hypothetical protein